MRSGRKVVTPLFSDLEGESETDGTPYTSQNGTPQSVQSLPGGGGGGGGGGRAKQFRHLQRAGQLQSPLSETGGSPMSINPMAAMSFSSNPAVDHHGELGEQSFAAGYIPIEHLDNETPAVNLGYREHTLHGKYEDEAPLFPEMDGPETTLRRSPSYTEAMLEAAGAPVAAAEDGAEPQSGTEPSPAPAKPHWRETLPSYLKKDPKQSPSRPSPMMMGLSNFGKGN